VTYKAGRYGFGVQTARLLEAEGYLIDTSLMPRSSYAIEGGPDFHRYDYAPFWFGTGQRLLELPVTRALIGGLASTYPDLYRRLDLPAIRRTRIESLLARSRLLERVMLSPEGNDLRAMQRLLRALLGRGQRIFMLQYHSPSLVPGNTPYVRNAYDLSEFMDRLTGFLSFFRDEIGGQFATPREVRERLLTLPKPAPDQKRCLVVANTFPPVLGGSAVVYDSLARFGAGRVSVLAPSEDYRAGTPIPGVPAFDSAAPYRVHRIRRLRTRLAEGQVGKLQRLATMVQDFSLRWNMVRTIRWIVRTENIGVLCIGELVASGWLTSVARRIFGVRCVIYVHGEEITVQSNYDADGRRKRRALAAADGVVAVSQFTREQLVQDYGVPLQKIELIRNGVDDRRFMPRSKRADLLARYGLGSGPVLLTVGRLCARKGVDKVIEALPALRGRYGSIRYLVVGEGAYRAELEARAQSLGVQDMVVFAGAAPAAELADHYALGDIFIMANRTMPDGDTEGFGLVFLEANAVGLPVIAGKAGGSVDAVSDEVNGLLVDGRDTAAIAAAVSRLLDDEPLRVAIAARGLEVARAASWEFGVRRFLDYCDRLATTPGPAHRLR
jgi:phosphatidylinositol alpha-1,6-mannosyltransferase